jgi:hypothetical protein
MRTILTAIAGMMLAGTLYGQEVDVCSDIYAPWGSDVNTVIRAGAKANLNFNEVTKQDSDGIIQLSFLNGSVARVFTFMYGKYVSFSLLNMDSDAVRRNRYTAKQMNMVLSAQSELNDEGAWVVACGTSTVKATLSTTRDQSSFRVMSMTALEALVDSKD